MCVTALSPGNTLAKYNRTRRSASSMNRLSGLDVVLEQEAHRRQV
jgi:hypothetical protein